MNEPKGKQLDINMSEEVAQGKYSNMAIISHTDNEFCMDFLNVMPGVPKGIVTSRIIMTPRNAKRLLNALRDNVRNFEENFGVIDDPNGANGGGRMPMMGGDGGLA